MRYCHDFQPNRAVPRETVTIFSLQTPFRAILSHFSATKSSSVRYCHKFHTKNAVPYDTVPIFHPPSNGNHIIAVTACPWNVKFNLCTKTSFQEWPSNPMHVCNRWPSVDPRTEFRNTYLSPYCTDDDGLPLIRRCRAEGCKDPRLGGECLNCAPWIPGSLPASRLRPPRS